MSNHETMKINLGTADVDKNIVPVVEWLNSKPEVQTLYSCEGEKEITEHVVGRPYVMFYCSDTAILVNILSEFQRFCDGVTEIDFYEGHIRYTYRFGCIESLEEFKNHLKARRLI